MKIAEIYRTRLSDPARAYCYYQALMHSYPTGDMKAQAEARIKELKKYEGTDCSVFTGDIDGGLKDTKTEKPKKDAIVLLGMRTFNSEDHTRVVLDVSGAAEYTFGRVKDGATKEASSGIYVDITHGALKKDVKEAIAVSGGQIRKITVDVKSDPLRVSMDPGGSVTYKVFSLKDPNRIVVDVYREERSDDKSDGTTNNAGDYYTKEKVTSHAIKVVVIDPGHGGVDPGAVGPTGYYEKTANFRIAQYLKEYLENQLGLKVIMTRNADRYLDLKNRTAVANEAGADLFISVHNNASASRNPYGITTYYLAITSDTKALAVAARENDTTIEKLTELDYILTDLMVSAKRNESSLLAKFVQEGMVNSIEKQYDNINNVGVCQGPFWVLVGAQMPSILVECSYISNKREENRLKSDDYLKGLAWGIYKGVEKYVRETDSMHAGR